MSRWIPYPMLSGALAASWLALTEVSVAHLAFALLLALSIPLALDAFLRHLPRMRAPLSAIRLILLVTWDIVIANIAVARLVLGPTARLRPAFVKVPLALQHPQSITLLASIITMTPGTVSCDVSEDRRELLLHVLDCPDAEQVVNRIKDRYEQALVEIFGC